MKKLIILASIVAVIGVGSTLYGRTNLFRGSMFGTEFSTEGNVKTFSSCEDLRQEILRYRENGNEVPQSLLQMLSDFQCLK